MVMVMVRVLQICRYTSWQKDWHFGQSDGFPSTGINPDVLNSSSVFLSGQELEVQGKELRLEASTLVPDSEYEARVRATGERGAWTEWSPLVHWRPSEGERFSRAQAFGV